MYKILEKHGGKPEDRAKIMGSEVALWTENVSGSSFEIKLFPRASAHGERTWSNPNTDYEQAQERLIEQVRIMIFLSARGRL